MALPEHLAEFERRVAARLSDAVEEMRRSLQAKAEHASSQLLTEIESYRPAIPSRLLEETELAGLERPSRDESRAELLRELKSALAALDGATTQGAALDALLAAARSGADRAALWLTQEDALVGWGSVGFSTNGGDPLAGARLSYGLTPGLERLARGRGTVRLAPGDAARLASELEVPAATAAAFVPIVLRDRLAAALYVDRSSGALELDLLQLLSHATAQRLELQGLSARSYTPTLVLEEEAPAGGAGLPLWNADEVAAEASAPAAEPQPFVAVEAPAEEAPRIAEPMPDADAFAEFELESSPELEVAETAPAPPETSDEPASDAFALPMPALELGHPALDASPSEKFVLTPPPAAPPAAAAADIAWEMEEADATVLMGSSPPSRDRDGGHATGQIPHAEPSLSEATVAFDRAALSGRPLDPPVADFALPSPPTAPPPPVAPPPGFAETQAIRTGSIATSEFPQPDLTDSDTTADLTEDATLLLGRAPAKPPAALGGSPTVAVPIAPPPAPPAVASPPPVVADDEPTISKGARTTEVAPPPDLQGPGWAFTASRAQRATGENALHEEARRLARLLISEIKLYNEEQVEDGRRNRDIYHRLKDDIDRSRQIYEERIHDSVRGTTDYFQQELVRSLAGGDPRALGI